MGRPARKDVDYFPFYIKDGRTLFILENKYECRGTGFFTNLLRFLSRTPNHHFQIEKEADKLYFFATVKCDEVSGLDMIEIMVETEKLDRALWVQRKVIASRDFLESIQDAYRKRLSECITIEEIKTFYGITTGGFEQTAGEITPKDECEEITTGNNPQRKGKETKGKETKGNKDNAHFDLFWQAYPKKKSKGQARKTWSKIKLPPIETILSSIAALRQGHDWMQDGGKYIPYPSTWLNAEGWEDEPQEYRPDLMPKSISEAERLEERMRGPRLKQEAEDARKRIVDKRNQGTDRPAIPLLPETGE